MRGALNEQFVLQSFYEERKNRSKAPKRHSLLQKNMSYFSNSTAEAQNTPPASRKYSQRKKNLQEYERNFRELTASLNPNQRVKNIEKQSFPEENHGYHPRIKSEKIVQNQNTSISISNKLDESSIYERADPLSQQDYFETNQQQYSSPNFRMNKEEINSPPHHTLHIDYDKKSAREQELEEKVQMLMARVQVLEKQNKKQSKFIDSVQRMRKTVEKVEQQCNIRQLWRWIKSLPGAH